jgi:hypothetical protein
MWSHDYSQYSSSRLIEMMQEALHDVEVDSRIASDWSEQSENRRHASERAANGRRMVDDIDAELKRREESSR